MFLTQIKNKPALWLSVSLIVLLPLFAVERTENNSFLRRPFWEMQVKDYRALKTIGYYLRRYGVKDSKVFNVTCEQHTLNYISEYYYNKQCIDGKNQNRQIFYSSNSNDFTLREYVDYWGFGNYDYVIVFSSAVDSPKSRNVFKYIREGEYYPVATVVDANNAQLATIYGLQGERMALDIEIYDKKFDEEYGKLSKIFTNKNIGLVNTFGGHEYQL